jgi:NhaP-type Na+/H+ or K+/H+ antiporter
VSFAHSLPIAADVTHLDVALTVLGCVLIVGALVSGIARRSLLSLAALFVLIGFVLGQGGLDVLRFHARSPFVGGLATLSLVVILFRDGLEVDAEMLQTHWRVPFRNLALAMPVTAVLIAAGARLLTDLSWTEALLLGALLSPTDPVLSSGVINNPRVPNVIRHSLNLESGLNDGLALPAVLAFSAALAAGESHFVWWKFVLEDISVGLATGVAIGLAASYVLPREDNREHGIPAHQKALYALGVAFLTYGATVLPPKGNGLIAVYVGAIVLGIRRPDIRECFEDQAEVLVEIAKIGIFVVFGALLTLHGLFSDGWAAVGMVVVALLVARPVAVMLALIGTDTDIASRGFMAWFGPRGVGTIAFALLVLSKQITAGEEIFNLAALVVVCSVLAHGLTDTPGADWIARRSERIAATHAAA